jgi:hypothetical protein
VLVCCRYGRWEVGVLTGFERWVVLLKLDELLMEGGRKQKGRACVVVVVRVWEERLFCREPRA